MKIISWNVNGYRAAWKKGFTGFLESVKPDVCLIQETKAWAEQLTAEQLNPVSYHSVFTQPEKKGYSGTAAFSLEEPASSTIGYGIDQFDSEGRVVIIELNKIIIANIYFPNGKASKERLKYKMDFYEATLKYFKNLLDHGKRIVIAGDYNTAHKPIDLAHPKQNEKTSGFLPEEREWIDRWIEAGFIDVFRQFNDQPEQYTWWDMRTRARDRNIGWRIDYFFVSNNLMKNVNDAWIMPEVMGSDHCPLGLHLAL
ncbi:exodeoxyribonuclease III [bacterium]|nr:exodeoxyribonuclease III [bacterium]